LSHDATGPLPASESLGLQRAPRVLVVDDEARNRRLLEGYLRSDGYRVRSVPDGRSAVEAAREDRPEVILLDVMMPEMTGHDVCRALKADPHTRLCQIMMVTALAGTSNKVEGLDKGADDYVSKPVRREEFLAKVRALVRVGSLLRELELARLSLAARNDELQLKRMLAQTIVHDLKSPLTAILANLELLRAPAGEGGARMIERSEQSALRMLEMIVNLLDVERLEEGKLVPRLERVDLAELARTAAEDARSTARAKGLTVGAIASGPIAVDVDPGLMRRVLDNLVANAIAHAPPQSGIDVSVARRPEGVELAVSDAGSGVPPDRREEIFEKYARLQVGVARSLNRGLGLTFCRLAVEAHGGTIWVDDAARGGACFHVLLPDPSSVAAESELAEVAPEPAR
jgi:signal transduction histidine kinase